ncbi:MAG: HAD family hydrolase [Pseudomonadota bacterium]
MKEVRPALFLDRDGVLNVDRTYVASIDALEWIEGAAECIRNFQARGWYVICVTNQSGIGMGHYTEKDMQSVHDHMQSVLTADNAALDAIYHCPYHPDATVARYRKDSLDRKPRPGMLLSAMADFPIKREASFLIGDKQTDIDAAHAAGVGGFLFKGGNLATFAEWALAAFEDGAR